MSFICISEQTAIISLYSIDWLVFITDGVCLLRGTDWVFKLEFLKGILFPELQYLRQHFSLLDTKRDLIFPTTIVFQNAVFSDNDQGRLQVRTGKD